MPNYIDTLKRELQQRLDDLEQEVIRVRQALRPSLKLSYQPAGQDANHLRIVHQLSVSLTQTPVFKSPLMMTRSRNGLRIYGLKASQPEQPARSLVRQSDTWSQIRKTLDNDS